MEEKKLRAILENHSKWLKDEGSGERADLRCANLHGADLRCANLHGADLQGADIDFSSWPIWCGGLQVKLCKKNMALLAMIFCWQDCDDEEVQEFQKALRPLVMQSHRYGEC